MTQLTNAILRVHWHGSERPTDIEVQYNPTEYTFDKQAQIAEIQIPGLDSPLQQFIRGQCEKLTLDLFFDTTESGMGAGATSVTTKTDKIYQLIKIEPERHAPPILEFVWSEQIAGAFIGEDQAASSLASQRRNAFRCVLESVRQKFTLFSPDGVPLRATLTVSLREYKTLQDQLNELKLSSPDRTHVHVLQLGETLPAVASRYYDSPRDWRALAEENRIDDPRRLSPGVFLNVPPLGFH